jgi:hypothetical protein
LVADAQLTPFATALGTGPSSIVNGSSDADGVGVGVVAPATPTEEGAKTRVTAKVVEAHFIAVFRILMGIRLDWQAIDGGPFVRAAMCDKMPSGGA